MGTYFAHGYFRDWATCGQMDMEVLRLAKIHPMVVLIFQDSYGGWGLASREKKG
jgi:hypothetical protein